MKNYSRKNIKNLLRNVNKFLLVDNLDVLKIFTVVIDVDKNDFVNCIVGNLLLDNKK